MPMAIASNTTLSALKSSVALMSTSASRNNAGIAPRRNAVLELDAASLAADDLLQVARYCTSEGFTDGPTMRSSTSSPASRTAATARIITS